MMEVGIKVSIPVLSKSRKDWLTQVKNQKQSKFEILLRGIALFFRKFATFLFEGACNRANFLNMAVQGVDQAVAHQCVMDKLTPFFARDQARIFQNAEMFRHGGFGYVETPCNLRCRQAGGGEIGQDLAPCGVGEGLENFVDGPNLAKAACLLPDGK